MADVSTAATATTTEHEHAHPGIGVYVKIGLILFALTALEVAVYSIASEPVGLGFGAMLHPVIVPILLVLSALKFALVAMYYMHLKQDSKLFSGVFIFPLIIAAVVIVALIVLFGYHHAFQQMIH